MQTNDVGSNDRLGEESQSQLMPIDNYLRVITVNDFQRVVGVVSKVIGAVHYDLKFSIASDTGDYSTIVVGATQDGNLKESDN